MKKRRPKITLAIKRDITLRRLKTEGAILDRHIVRITEWLALEVEADARTLTPRQTGDLRD